MRRVSDLVNEFWSDYEIDKLQSRHHTLTFWEAAAGKRLSSFCSVEGFSESTVIIKAFNSAVAMELRYRSREILAALNELAGTELFQSLRIVFRPIRHRER
jgi:predicted nucleic acid-binding Zn ribbon protein